MKQKKLVYDIKSYIYIYYDFVEYSFHSFFFTKQQQQQQQQQQQKFCSRILLTLPPTIRTSGQLQQMTNVHPNQE